MFLRGYHSARGQSFALMSSAVIETDEPKDEGILPRAYWFSPGRNLKNAICRARQRDARTS